MDATLIRRRVEGPVAQLTLAHPASRNALSAAMIAALDAALDEALAARAVRVIVLDGEGPAFSAGHDLKEMLAHRNDGDRGRGYDDALFAACAAVMTKIATCAKPVIAAVEGVATAAGCQLVASCDLAIAGAGARFATPGVTIGLFCSTPMVALSRAVSAKHAMEMLLLGDMIDAEAALRFGLVNRVVPAGNALGAARDWAAAIAAKSPDAIAAGKPLFHAQCAMDLGDAYAAASQVMADNLAGHDAHEGIAAFLAKRTPRWAADEGEP
jgi:enoyl-CoA hydratase/carnithine racemase